MYWENLKVVKIEDALDFSLPQLSVIKKEKGEIFEKAFLVEAVADLVMFFNIGKTMNEQQVVQVVKMISQRYYYLRPAELKYCFDKAKFGDYGKVYDRIDGAVIFEWIELYLEERENAIIQKNIENKKKEESNSESVLAVFLGKGIKFEPKKIEGEVVEKKKIERTEKDLIIQKAFKEFDELHKTNEVPSKGVKLIKYEGEIYDSVEFAERKLHEHYNEKK